MQQRLLSLNHVGKTFSADIEALRDMSLTVAEGDFLSLLGPSGCGKSTALRLIAGLTEPTTGHIAWHGEQTDHSIGFVFQEPTLMPWATVEKNVWLPFRLNGDSFSSVRELSGGMKMRVSIARALATNPRIILMDEPFAALDEITRFRLNNDLLKLKAKLGCTIIFVTHSVFESVFLSSRIAVMAARPGRVIRELEIDAPYPRGERFRTSADYVAHCRTTSEALQESMNDRD